MKRLLLISFEYPIGRAYCGGVGQIVKQSRDVFLKLGYEVYVLISSHFEKRYPIKLLLPDSSLIRFRNFWAFNEKYDWHRFNYIIQHFVNWTKELRKIKGQGGRRPKIVYHFHSILKREKDSGFKTFNRFLLNQEKMIEIADRIICPSRYEYDNFIRYFPCFGEKVALIENTVETFPPQEQQIQSIRDSYGIRKGDIISIYVGRLERIKGAHILIRHIPKILNRHKNLKIFIIGKTSERDLYRKFKRVQKRFPHQFFNIRYLEKCMLFQYYYLGHIYINTSLSESFSLSTHESALCGNALLLNWLSVFDKFKDAALFFSNHDGAGDDFVLQYEKLIRDRLLRKRLSQKAKRIARNFLTTNRLNEDFSRFFDEL